MASIELIRSNGFGEHAFPVDASSVQRAQIIHLVAKTVFWCETAAFAVLGILALASVITFPPGAIAALVIGYASTAFLTHLTYWNYRSNAMAFYGLSQPVEQTSNAKGEFCEGIPCKDTVESFEWKKKLIEKAEHSIVLSGNYCGGKSFNQILEIIERRLAEVPDLKVVIIASPMFIRSDNQETIDRLQSEYPDNFQLIASPDIVHVNPSIKKTTNHTKSLVIDGGRYFILGGSGIEDKYAFHDGLKPQGKDAQSSGIMDMILPRGFRDMDFVFSSPDYRSGREVYLQTLKLAYRWEGIDYVLDRDIALQNPEEFSQIKSVTRSLLQNFDPDLRPGSYFDDEFGFFSKMKVRIFCTGPEQTENLFEKELVRKINKAKKQLYIDHMYYHPSEKVQSAIVRAVNRGVSLVLITNGNGKGSPGSHKLFGDRNRYQYIDLLQRIDKKFRKNVHVYEFKVKKTTLHKKVMVVDNCVFGGSSNLGYKSLETMSDHEMNFMAESGEFAREVIKILRVDRRRNVHAGKIYGSPKFSFGQKWAALRHRILAPLIG